MAQLLFPLSPGGAGDPPAEWFPRPGLAEWKGANPRFGPLHRFCREKTDLADFRPHFNRWTDDEMANCALCLAHMVDKALTTVIAQKDEKFVTQGGIKERMAAARLSGNSPSTPANASACPTPQLGEVHERLQGGSERVHIRQRERKGPRRVDHVVAVHAERALAEA